MFCLFSGDYGAIIGCTVVAVVVVLTVIVLCAIPRTRERLFIYWYKKLKSPRKRVNLYFLNTSSQFTLEVDHGWASAELPRNRFNVNLLLRHIRDLSW